MSEPAPRKQRKASWLYLVWLLVFVLELVLMAGNRALQVGALAFAVLFTVLVVTELRSDSDD